MASKGVSLCAPVEFRTLVKAIRFVALTTALAGEFRSGLRFFRGFGG
jgi:hypothetical protein